MISPKCTTENTNSSKKAKNDGNTPCTFAFYNYPVSGRPNRTSFTCSNPTKCFVALLVDICQPKFKFPLSGRWESINLFMPLPIIPSLALVRT